MTKSYINSRTINHDVIYSYTLLYGFNQQLTNPRIPNSGHRPRDVPFIQISGLLIHQNNLLLRLNNLRFDKFVETSRINHGAKEKISNRSAVYKLGLDNLWNAYAVKRD